MGIFSGMAKFGLGAFTDIEIIEDKAENIETVWWITNHPSVKETIPHKIIAKKILGKTEVEEI